MTRPVKKDTGPVWVRVRTDEQNMYTIPDCLLTLGYKSEMLHLSKVLFVYSQRETDTNSTQHILKTHLSKCYLLSNLAHLLDSFSINKMFSSLQILQSTSFNITSSSNLQTIPLVFFILARFFVSTRATENQSGGRKKFKIRWQKL